MSTRTQEFPFREGLKPLNERHGIWTYPGAETIVRSDEHIYPRSKEAPDLIREKRHLLEELPGYGIETINAAFVVSNSDVLMVTQKVHGADVTERTKSHDLPTPAVQRADEVFDNLYGYLSHKSQTGEPFLKDIASFYQFMYDDERQNFCLVDIGGGVSEKRETNPVRFEEEMLNASFLVGSAISFYADSPGKLAEWQTKSKALLKHVCESNGVKITEKQAEELAYVFMDGDPDEKFDPLLSELIRMPENDSFRNEMRLKFEAERKRAATQQGKP